MLPYFDLHCDTISECFHRKQQLLMNRLDLDLQRASKVAAPYIQCFAAFIPDKLKGDDALKHFLLLSKCFQTEMKANSEILRVIKTLGDLKAVQKSKKVGAIFTIENGNMLCGNLENVDLAAAHGVKMMTLTWNGDNEIGTGAHTTEVFGLTEFGVKVIHALEKNGIVIDISHASDRLFDDVVEYTKGPFIASHSNSRVCCDVKRNLTDHQFKLIRECGGLVGLNFYKGFLHQSQLKADIVDILRHAEHFLALGGEDVLSMGSDFDGAELPQGMSGITSVSELYELFLHHNYSENLLRKIFFGNAMEFFERHLSYN